jgi:hypothetical protein
MPDASIEYEVRFAFHEARLNATICSTNAFQEHETIMLGRERRLLDYYLGKGGKGHNCPHPDDINLPLNLWEKVKEHEDKCG